MEDGCLRPPTTTTLRRERAERQVRREDEQPGADCNPQESTGDIPEKICLNSKRGDIRPDVQVPDDLGKSIDRDTELVREQGWLKFVAGRRGRGDMTVNHCCAYKNILFIS